MALNPALFYRTDLEILSTLVHEMTHLWQEHHAQPSRNGYHNRKRADKMIAIGLPPSDTGQPGGKVTGQSMTHYVLDGGAFKTAAIWLLDDDWTITFASVEGTGLVVRPGLAKGEDDNAPNGDDGSEEEKLKKPKSKVKFTCPACGQNTWGKPSLNIICGQCSEQVESKEA